GRLRQVFWNLLSNAIKFSPPGGSVQATAAREGTSVVVKVGDAGQGIGAEFLPYVFDSFRQEAATKTRRQGGLGLGLAIVRPLIEAHGGAVQAHSDGAGKGALFTIALPVCAGADGDTIEPAGVNAAQLAGLRVLVVEGEE